MNDFTTKIVICFDKGEEIDEIIQQLFRLEQENGISSFFLISSIFNCIEFFLSP